VAIFESSTQGTVVTNSATQIFSTSGLTSPVGLLVQNQGAVTVYLGGSSVTASATGPALAAGQEAYFSGAAQNLWAITASGSCPVLAGLASVAAVV
jgi:hypothetical protein